MPIWVPAEGVTVICPEYWVLASPLALAVTVRVAGLLALMVKVLVVALSQLALETKLKVIAEVLVVDRVTFWEVSWPENALIERDAGLAVMLPLPPPPPLGL